MRPFLIDHRKMKKAVVMVAGGAGKRMGTSGPKQFIEIAGKPLLMHTIMRFYDYDPAVKIILVLPLHHIETWDRLCARHRFAIAHRYVSGGEERYFSVKNGLAEVDDDMLVAIHDGVRPLVSEQVIDNAFRTAAKHGSAIPVIRPSESLRYQEGNKNLPVDRDHYFLVQTPQVFHAGRLKKAYETPFKETFTDDATVFEAAGYSLRFIEGNTENIKITRPADLRFAECLLGK
jgi:2-C-methyl-D-erythritol 4-phosphate cytidylyltransferase